MIKLMYVLSSVVTILVLIGIALLGEHLAWSPMMFMSMILIGAVGMTVLMTAITILLQRWQKEREQNDDKR
ncbi:hypothetical protein ACRHK7_00560 [Weissella tructae]|uniref:Uncharacterized protein n=2 Tax=Weissella TaxID=46255 RepID=A0A075TZG9_9LACO|nr:MULTISPECIES: hypothetical protein [Weissella]AIM62601.1 hypothetical protein WS74_0349 [Weissella ceti]AIG65288.1 hypothetical protein WS08_0349 [Weissella tructae]AIM63937.1 hypothetical protein WS105_0347 [Weissella ceti]ELA07690.1 hypothetical protein WCNC_01765 [Weissella ceti NC36]QVV91669.1 hypothetical protein KHQ32_01975 [Weissella tructae]